MSWPSALVGHTPYRIILKISSHFQLKSIALRYQRIPWPLHLNSLRSSLPAQERAMRNHEVAFLPSLLLF
ncbi:MAG: hypothetical protein EB078_01715, partial [Proteobacteria bacterium]|nr:hypothetical protein [Pseudomonadota bacterium]